MSDQPEQQREVVLIDYDLDNELTVSLSWLRQMLGQLEGEKPWTMTWDDPMGMVRAIDDLRSRLEAAGVNVPPIADPAVDPLGNMMGWRDFLASFMTVH